GVLGWTYKCKPAGGLDSEIDANNYVYIILQRGEKEFKLACEGLGFQDWLTNPDFATADARDKHKDEIYKRIGAWAADKTKFEITEQLSKYGVPVGPVLSTKEVMSDQSLYDGNTLVRINQGGKIGEFVTVGCPFTLSSFQPVYGPAPELGADTADVLKAYGYTDQQIEAFAKNGTTEPLPAAQK
ncbi:MAG: CoA transferase, partial [Duncaniella sp.]|nr:CoA transferase [Duncaniella sp.]